MEAEKIYKDIACRTGGDIYIGVVGPVRSGKSTFINRFMETAVIPNIVDEYAKKRARDELPQSADGKTVMTAEPKFIPDEAVEVSFGDGANIKMRMIDCVGYLIPGALGMTEDGEVRMVKTPWSDEPVTFEKAAEEGTKKVMLEHSTVGMLVTCDGTVGDIPRESYVEAEERIAGELKEIGKPFVLILNSKYPESKEAESLALNLEEKYSCPVALVSCKELDRSDIENILEILLYEFPVREISISLPQWIGALPENHQLNTHILDCLRKASGAVRTLSDSRSFCEGLEAALCEKLRLSDNKGACKVSISSVDLSEGRATVGVELPESLYYGIIRDLTGLDVDSQSGLISILLELSGANKELSKYKEAIDQLESGGYGIVMPKMQDLTLSEPEIIKSSGAYGVRLCAKAQSIHMIRAEIETEINPIVGTQEQAEEMIQRLVGEYEDDPQRLWESNIFGKSLYELVNDGLNTKIDHLSPQSREKLSETLSRIINESSNGLICILL
ncbi:MAG: stage IV sporulation protein A [Ruminococcaceae bacterium]|nr:stage IV sporulation protein A [Oscillospiraceae bacterium]